MKKTYWISIFIIAIIISTQLYGCKEKQEERIIGMWEVHLIYCSDTSFNMNDPYSNNVSFMIDGLCCIPSTTDPCPFGSYKIGNKNEQQENITIKSSGFFEGTFELNFYDGYFMRLENENWDIHLKLKRAEFFSPFESSTGYEGYVLPETDDY
ncbi:MAG: hypothetical protein H6600_04385 [Flavobacteriales bacterium]|nr:hypothetical protein [Flavobacteriales bacterium]